MESPIQHQGPDLDSAGFQDPVVAAEWDIWNAQRALSQLENQQSPMANLIGGNLDNIRHVLRAAEEMGAPHWVSNMIMDQVIMALRHAAAITAESISAIRIYMDDEDNNHLSEIITNANMRMEALDTWLQAQITLP